MDRASCKALIVWLVILAGCEVIAREWTSLKGNPVDKTLSLLKPDSKIGWRNRPFIQEYFFGAQTSTDAEGYRTLEDSKSDGEGELWAFGPSSTFGWGVAASGIYPFESAKLLGRRAKNFGQIGHASWQGFRLLEENPPPSGAVVLFAYGINDLDRYRFFFPSPMTDKKFFSTAIPPSMMWFATLSSRSHAFRYLLRMSALFRGKINCALPPEMPRRIPDEDFLENLNQFKAAVEKNKARLVVIDTPYWPVTARNSTSEALYAEAEAAYRAGDCGKSREFFQKFIEEEPNRIVRDQRVLNGRLNEWAKKNRVTIIRASALLSVREDFVDPVHPSSAGHKKIADAIRAELSKDPPPQ